MGDSLSFCSCNYIIYSAACCLLAIYFTTNAEADNRLTAEFSGTLGLGLERFDYVEKDDNGSLLDKEEGDLPTLSFSLKAQADKAFVTGLFRYSASEVDYTAYPGTESKLKSHTTQKITEMRLFGGYQQRVHTSLQLEYIVGFGYREWNRNIHSLSTIPGLDECYQWPYANLGVRSIYKIDQSNSLSLLLDYKQAFNANLEVEFKRQQYDPVSIDLKNGQGLSLSFAWNHRVDHATEVVISPYLDLWRFGKTKLNPLKNSGMVVGAVHEPENRTNNYGMELTVQKNF